VLRSAFAREYQTRIREAAKRRPNFAGKYRVAYWGCGTSCRIIAVIDEVSGQVYEGPFHALDYDGEVRYADGSLSYDDGFEPLDFRNDSRLLIVRGAPLISSPTGFILRHALFYYEWRQDHFVLLKKIPATSAPPP
jgi:hypothetical protein